MDSFFMIGPLGTLHVFGIKLVGLNADNGGKLLITFIFICLALILAQALRALTRWTLRSHKNVKVEFWTRQGINLILALLLVLGVCSIWFDDPTRLTTAVGLVTAGLAFALQRVVTALAGYIVILRGKTFSVGDRIVMGGVRGDVVALGFIQTSIMEMGQPPSVQTDQPGMWVRSRQFTGRIVTVPNSKIFDEPVYNYTREFDYIWEEMSLPVSYTADRKRAEEILLEAAARHQAPIDELKQEDIKELQRRYYVVNLEDFQPRVFYRMTDNWLELSVRFITDTHGVRGVKDKMAREMLDAMEASGIGVASATFELVGMPPLRLEVDGSGVKSRSQTMASARQDYS
ncbi:MAG TPA: mechanosensitive ion channel domain-containing protein [Oligoflexus sp.]|uniref:mechanosensitive ion channel family protein n=1 Tax=Oligoflexus sp. TaxID=1971216 RepID=UPI002D33F3ED|nr:mechanosensitive ion channel domain-containing protein [Oligoflexus sp.]HYX37103.1 mechanosensitive ion channel domain-containing protein [Oligoflexus sp.]